MAARYCRTGGAGRGRDRRRSLSLPLQIMPNRRRGQRLSGESGDHGTGGEGCFEVMGYESSGIRLSECKDIAICEASAFLSCEIWEVGTIAERRRVGNGQ